MAAIIVIGSAGFGVARAATSGRVLGDVVTAGVTLGGLAPEEAASALAARHGELVARPATFLVESSTLTVVPQELGFALDVGATVDDAMSLGRAGSLPGQFWWWLTHLVGPVELDPVASLDPEATENVLLAWDAAAIPDVPFEGAVEVVGTSPVAVEPRPGRRIDRSSASDLLVDGIVAGEPTRLPVVTVEPAVSPAAVDAARAAARRWLAGPAILRNDVGEVTFQVADLAAALRSKPSGDGGLRLLFDPGVVDAVLAGVRASIEQAPVDARLVVDGYAVRVEPGSPGTVVDPDAAAAALAVAVEAPDRTGVLPVEEGADPDVTTAELEALGITHLVSQFTTYHDCCGNRVKNIHLIADTLDGTIVEPGERLSLNDAVGRRTAADGYLEDGTIVGGELTTTVGGGVSQFATTFYNAVFWGGYEDVSHQPHSLYFTRYPEGIEATISWPAPDLVFRNDSAAGVLVGTEYTDTSITVKLYGSNDGRIVSGRHRNGRTELTVVEPGGPGARVVSAEVSDRFNPTEPGTEYRANPAIPVGQPKVVQKPSPGWSVRVTRAITVGGVEETETWTVRYSPRRQILEVNPCEVPGSAVACPTTTTPPSTPTTTTTTVPAPLPA